MTDPMYVYRDRDPRFEAFDGKPGSWPYYSTQLCATANNRDYGGIYKGTIVSASKAVSTAARSIELSACRRNIRTRFSCTMRTPMPTQAYY